MLGPTLAMKRVKCVRVPSQRVADFCLATQFSRVRPSIFAPARQEGGCTPPSIPIPALHIGTQAQDSLHHKQCTLNILNATAEAMSVHHEKVRLRAVTTLYETVARVRAKDQDDLTLLRKHNEAGGSKPAETLGMQVQCLRRGVDV